jgi:hypothetical protein
MWIIWAICALATIVLFGYRSNLTRDEDSQIFLDEAFAHEKALQGQIASKLNRVQPLVRTGLVATGIMSAIVVAYYLYHGYTVLFG